MNSVTPSQSSLPTQMHPFKCELPRCASEVEVNYWSKISADTPSLCMYGKFSENKSMYFLENARKSFNGGKENHNLKITIILP
ncbi:unnamed protein product [Hymenolepis diminuta]|uniref:Uncharacterized protein n=1 Tax=Hymenolepis diminuta TaxID=6216 RepID=A0A564YVY4_HYMDI|nr:unnamed protein product [Hymenolepis diminuta]